MKTVRKTKILIIEDELIIAADIQLELQQLGYEVIGIHQSGKEAILSIKKEQPDLVLIDFGLKGDDNGLQAARHILENAPVPILFLSYGINQATLQQMMETKPYAFIPKPFQVSDLERGVQTALQRIAIEKRWDTNTNRSDSNSYHSDNANKLRRT